VKVTRKIYVGVLLVLIITIINGLYSFHAACSSPNDIVSKVQNSYDISAEDSEPNIRMDLPFCPGTVLSDKVEQVIICQNLLFKKLLVCLTPGYNADVPSKMVAQYNFQVIQSLQNEPKAVFCCRLQI
jgi:hypothetical protein